MNYDLPACGSTIFTIAASQELEYPRVHVEELSDGPWALH